MTHTNTARPIDAHLSDRAKIVTPRETFRRVSPARLRARDQGADVLATSCAATGTTYAEAAAALELGPTTLSTMARRGGGISLAVPDVLALDDGGCRKLANRIVEEVRTILDSRTRRLRLTPADHLRVLTAKLGALAAAPTDAAYAHALRELQDRVRDALLDVQEAA